MVNRKEGFHNLSAVGLVGIRDHRVSHIAYKEGAAGMSDHCVSSKPNVR